MIRLNHARSLVDGTRSLYSKWAGHPELGPLRASRAVRIWTSSGLPWGPITVVCKRLVQVELGHRDVVLEPALHRRPRGVDRTRARRSSPGPFATMTRMPTRSKISSNERPLRTIFS